MNNTLFSSSELVANEAGGSAYALDEKNALAQYVCTGTFNGTYYSSGSDQLEAVKKLVINLRKDPRYIAKLAVYGRNEGKMKDMPAFLCAVLACWGEHELFHLVFDKVINDGKMLRNFVQIGRSGQAGRKLNMSAGACRKAIQRWFDNHNEEFIFRGSLGNNPSFKDILALSHVKPNTKSKAALFAYLYGHPVVGDTIRVQRRDGVATHDFNDLPDIVKNLELFKRDKSRDIPRVDFRLLDSILTADDLKRLWLAQAQTANFDVLRMNLNNMVKYDALKGSVSNRVASILSNPEQVARSKCFPYQIMNAFKNCPGIPYNINDALQTAMELSVENVPSIDGQIYICVDTSGSMQSPITGYSSVGSAVSCVDVAGLFASTILRKNPSAVLIPFDTKVKTVNINPRDSIMTNAQKLALRGGGTNCACAIEHINSMKGTGNAIIFISDNESWVNSAWGRGTAMMDQWKIFKRRNPQAKLVCIDLVPNQTTQVKESKDVLNVGGFSDAVFTVVADFINNSDNHWMDMIRNIQL